jgi:hypothetical protein
VGEVYEGLNWTHMAQDIVQGKKLFLLLYWWCFIILAHPEGDYLKTPFCICLDSCCLLCLLFSVGPREKETVAEYTEFSLMFFALSILNAIAAVWARYHDRSCGICGAQGGIGAGFLQVWGFTCQFSFHRLLHIHWSPHNWCCMVWILTTSLNNKSKKKKHFECLSLLQGCEHINDMN